MNPIVLVSHRGSLRPLADEPAPARNPGACHTAGSIPDVPQVCDGGLPARTDGRQPFLPVGATAVNSGGRAVAGHSLSVLLLSPQLFPLQR